MQEKPSHLREQGPLGEDEGEAEVAREGVRKGPVELKNLLELLHIDGVYITVGEGSHMHHALGLLGLLPLRVPAHVAPGGVQGARDGMAPSKEGKDLSVLDHLQGAGHHEAELSDELPLPDDEVPRCAVGHLEVGGQGS